MALAGKWTKIWVEGYNIASKMSAITPEMAWDEIDVSAYTNPNHRFLAGMSDPTITLEGYFDATTNSSHDALKTITSGADTIVTYAIGNNALPALGDPAGSLVSQELAYTVVPVKEGVVAVNATFKSRGNNLEWGKLLMDSTITANTNGSSINNSASSSNGGYGYLHILGTSAGDTITVKIQDSTDDAAWADLITFTLDGTAADAQRLTVSGTVDQYVRASVTVAGSSISFPIAVTFVRL